MLRRLCERLLRRAIPVHRADEILQDLGDEYDKHQRPKRGRVVATIWYLRQVLLTIRVYTSSTTSLHSQTLVPRDLTWPTRRAFAGFVKDLEYAARSLRGEAGLATVIVVTLTFGIAGTSVMFGVVDQLLLRPPAGIGDAANVRQVFFGTDAPQCVNCQWAKANSYPVVDAIRRNLTNVAGGAAIYRAEVTVGTGAEARPAAAELVDPNYFSVLQVQPSAGRFFISAEGEAEDTHPVAVISHRFWTSEFGKSQHAVGRKLLVEGKSLEIVGVAPPSFSGIEGRPIDFWTPVGALGRELLGAGWETNYGRYAFALVVRFASGGSTQRSSLEATHAYRDAAAASGMPPDPLAKAVLTPVIGLDAPNGLVPEGKVSLWLLSVAGIVLLVAGANVSNLLLTRALKRRQELAVRVALGASRGRLIRQLMTESFLLAMLATLASLVVCFVGSRLIQKLLLPAFAWSESVFDLRLLVVVLAVGGLMAFLTGLAPIGFALSSRANGTLRGATRTAGGGVGRFRTTLLIAQAAFSALLLVGAGLFMRSLYAVHSYDVGVDIERVIVASLPVRSTVPKAEANALYSEAVEKLNAIAGIDRVAVTRSSAPMKGGQSISILPQGMTFEKLGRRPVPVFAQVDAGYFTVLGTAFIRGRDLSVEDERAGARVAVINRTLADSYWPHIDPLGQCVQLGSDAACTQIVGLVEDVVFGDRTNTARGHIYVSHAHPGFKSGRPAALLIRTRGEAASLVPVVRGALQSLRPDLRYVQVDSMESLLAPQLKPWRLGTSLLLVFGVVALAIAAVGIYSAMAYAVSQRNQEIAIRMALGATRWDVISTVGSYGVATISMGLAAGLLMAFFAAPRLREMLFQTSPRDPLVFAAVGVVLLFAGIIATVVPARRSAYANPAATLKAP